VAVARLGGNEDVRREAAMRRSKKKNEKKESGGEERKFTKSERGKERVNSIRQDRKEFAILDE
jgi:hypothetical protein